MPQILPATGSLWGNVGRGFGQGLAEQLPKEIERGRLSEGLQNFQKNAANLSPMQQLAEISTIPGITPQMIQSFGELAQKQSQANALQNKVGKPQPFPVREPAKKEPSTGVTTPEGIEATRKPFITPSQSEQQAEASKRYNENPGFYKNDPINAINEVKEDVMIEQKRNAEIQGQREGEHNVQNRLQSELQTQLKNLGVQVPGNIYSEIENEAINSIKPKSEGGQGLTEYEAGKKYAKELDKVSRDYKALDDVGKMDFAIRGPKEIKNTLKRIRNGFKERGDEENLADEYVARNGLSYSKGYYLAYPISDIKELNNEIVKLPKLTLDDLAKQKDPEAFRRQKTLDVAEKIASKMGTKGSILSIAEELKSRGYDPETWMNYVDKNRKKLELGERQGRELQKPRNWIPSMNDIWLFSFSGLDELLEQK
jgi:hypothetical protein